MKTTQKHFDKLIGQLDRVLSEMIFLAKASKDRIVYDTSDDDEVCSPEASLMDTPNQQTLKHHAEDMVAAGNKILELLGKKVESTPQPDHYKDPCKETALRTNQPSFTFLAQDKHTLKVIRFWVLECIKSGMSPSHPKLINAAEKASAIVEWQKTHGNKTPD